MVALSQRYRSVLVVVLSLLLVGMQQEALRHALTHFRSAPTHQELSKPQADVLCAECALVKAGSGALVSDAPSILARHSTHVTILPAPDAPTPARLSFYRSRAPPTLL